MLLSVVQNKVSSRKTHLRQKSRMPKRNRRETPNIGSRKSKRIRARQGADGAASPADAPAEIVSPVAEIVPPADAIAEVVPPVAEIVPPADAPTDAPTDAPADGPTDAPTDAPTDGIVPPTDAPAEIVPPTDAPAGSEVAITNQEPEDRALAAMHTILDEAHDASLMLGLVSNVLEEDTINVAGVCGAVLPGVPLPNVPEQYRHSLSFLQDDLQSCIEASGRLAELVEGIESDVGLHARMALPP